jgi:glycosyltransferase involved in cell wall biosynthesis
VGDPHLAGYEQRGNLHLHRWCQWVSAYHPGGVYDGEWGKQNDYASSLPPYLMRQHLEPCLRAEGSSVVLAEEWQTVNAVLHLHQLLCEAGLRERVTMLWNANNLFGFDSIPWAQLREAASITTVSRYMKQRMREWGVEARVIPNGLPPDAFEAPDREAVAALRRRFRDRIVLAKMARWDPDKRWIESLDLTAELKRRGWRPLLVARGGSEPYGDHVRAEAGARGLRVAERRARISGSRGLVEVLDGLDDADVVDLRSYVDPVARRTLFRSSDAVLANSGHEPFGLVGLETMAAGGIACTGGSGEDYAVPGQNALVLESGEPEEFIGLYRRLRSDPGELRNVRRNARTTARRYAWPEVVRRVLLPRLELSRGDRAALRFQSF